MNNLLKLSFFIFFFSCVDNVDYTNNIKNDVMYLSDDKLEGRKTGTEGEKLAAKYISERFEKLNLSSKGTTNYYQDFYFSNNTNPHEEIKFDKNISDNKIHARNVIGFLDNGGENTVVIGAHYDHLGYGEESSLYFGDEVLIHNGADDNASGTSLLLDLANKLVMEDLQSNYLFIAFSGEEMGLLGSNYFLKNPTVLKNDINYMINMDMVGRLNEENKLSVSGIGSAKIFKQIVNSNNNEFNLIEFESSTGFGSSDHASFYYEDIPVLSFFTGQHEDYHQPSDDYDKINYQGISKISEYIFDIIKELDSKNKLNFIKIEETKNTTPRFKVGLGVMPDYLYNEGGMRISAITSKDKPAAKIGLIKGDIVVKIGEYDIIDMMGYMNALSMFTNGDKTKIRIKRDGEFLSFDLIF
jgi:Zn-dependent M28 family amino/carboxypeptidase